MINFKSNRINNEYLMIDAHPGLKYLIFHDELPDKVKIEVTQMCKQFRSFEGQTKTGYISEIAIRKDSLVGEYLINNSDQIEIINDDLYIYHKNVINAHNVAIYTGNDIAKKIEPLIMKKVRGPKERLLKQYEEEVLDYILGCDSFLEYVNPHLKAKEYVVFENGEYSQRILSESCKTKTK